MNEISLQILASLKIVWIAVFTLFYGLGGTINKSLRRFVGALWALAGIILFSILAKDFSYWYLLYAPLLIGALSLGYGGQTFGEKIRKRLICGTAYALTAIPIAIVTGQWLLFGIHSAICVSFSILLGVFNPIPARSEETLIAVSITMIPLFMV